MFQFQVEINEDELQAIINGFDNIIDTTMDLLYRGGGRLNRKGALLFSQHVRNLILRQDLPSYPAYSNTPLGVIDGQRMYPPVSYREWKATNHPDKGWHRLRDELVDSLTYFKVGNGWMGGVPKGTPGYRGRPVAMRASYNEFGSPGGKIPPRPVFQPAMQSFVREFGPALLTEAEKKLISAWRAG